MCLEDRKVMDLMPDLVSFAGLFRMGMLSLELDMWLFALFGLLPEA